MIGELICSCTLLESALQTTSSPHIQSHVMQIPWEYLWRPVGGAWCDHCWDKSKCISIGCTSSFFKRIDPVDAPGANEFPDVSNESFRELAFKEHHSWSIYSKNFKVVWVHPGFLVCGWMNLWCLLGCQTDPTRYILYSNIDIN